MKKIEAVIDRAGLEALEIHLAQAGIEGRPTLTQISIIETLGRFYGLREARDARWKPCVKLDLIVSDCETQSAVNMILQHANLVRSGGCGGQINILPLDVMREISAGASERRPGTEGKSERFNPFERLEQFVTTTDE